MLTGFQIWTLDVDFSDSGFGCWFFFGLFGLSIGFFKDFGLFGFSDS
jgi:hypothetical protein